LYSSLERLPSHGFLDAVAGCVYTLVVHMIAEPQQFPTPFKKK
jgi:hypothetical protein